MRRLTRAFLTGLVFCLLLAAPSVGAQEGGVPPAASGEAVAAPAPPPVDPRFDSPQATLRTFLGAGARWQAAKAYSDERSAALDTAVACFDLPAGAKDSGPDVASRLYQVLGRIGEIRWTLLPNRATAEATGLDRFRMFPWDRLGSGGGNGYADVRRAAGGSHIDLVRTGDGTWRFSPSTAEGVSGFLRAVEHLPMRLEGGPVDLTPADWIRSRVPLSLRTGEFLSLEYWQWIGLLLIILLGFTVDLIVRGILRLIWTRVTRRRGLTPDREVLGRAVRPFGLFASAIVWYLLLGLLGLPPGALRVILLAVHVFLMLAAVWAAYRVTDVFTDFLMAKARATETKVDDILVPLLRKTLKVFIAAVGLVYIADSFEIEIVPLLTGLGIGGLAFAFAAKDTIENFFGSIAVILDRPFEVGDWVVIDEVEGIVEELGLRSTRVRTFYNSLVTVPNATLVRSRVDNYGKRRYRRFSTHLDITYDTPPERIEAFCAGIREIIRNHPYTRKDYYHVWLNEFGAASLRVLVYMFHETPEWGTELRERHRFMLDVIRLADRLGVEFAFPTQTLHVFQEEHGKPHTPAPVPGDDAETAATGRGADAARALLGNVPWKGEPPPPVEYAPPKPPATPEEEAKTPASGTDPK